MSLALVQLSTADFQLIHDHLVHHKPPYRNLHMRQTRTLKGQRTLHYLHAMYASGSSRIEGMISGPSVFWHYDLTPGKSQTIVRVFSRRSSAQDATRIQGIFRKEIMKRIGEEQSGRRGFPRYKHGQFYLRRRRPGTPATHPHCQAAISSGVLDQRFVSTLLLWDFELLHP